MGALAAGQGDGELAEKHALQPCGAPARRGQVLSEFGVMNGKTIIIFGGGGAEAIWPAAIATKANISVRQHNRLKQLIARCCESKPTVN